MSKTKKKKPSGADIYMSIRKKTPKTGGPFKDKRKKKFDWRREISELD